MNTWLLLILTGLGQPQYGKIAEPTGIIPVAKYASKKDCEEGASALSFGIGAGDDRITSIDSRLVRCVNIGKTIN